RPLGHQARQLARLGVVSPEGSVGAQPGGAEEHDGVVDALPLEHVQGLEVLGEDAQRARGVTVEKGFVPVGERRIGGRHGAWHGARGMALSPNGPLPAAQPSTANRAVKTWRLCVASSGYPRKR